MTPYILLLLGLLFVWLEFYLPGGAFAIAAALFVLASLTSYFTQNESVIGVIGFFCVTLAAVAVVIKLAIWRIRKSAANDTFFLSKDQEGYKALEISKELVGKRGVTSTECGPSGFAIIDHVRYPVVCRGPYLAKGVPIEVIAQELGNLIVKPLR